MPLNAGERLGSYEILSPLGAGGMGEVYRARDTKLGREVAIKVLPEEFTQHPQKLARFEREARLLAALNHPGIATLYGVEKKEGKPFLVMELVEGQTLADRISIGPIPVGEALELSQQIAEALDAAHEKGVVHRDLKPANIKVDPEGKVKVLDFGLAKVFTEETAETDTSFSPTLSRDATRAGVILGTAAYMSPEQAKGKTVDKRTDVFSFGIVLFEMLTGKRAFAGEDVSDVLAHILASKPDWKALSGNVPPSVVKLLRRCLEKDRKKRLRDIADARYEIQEILAEPTDASAQPVAIVAPSRTPERLAWGVGILAAALFAGVAVWNLTPEPERRVGRFVVGTPATGSLLPSPQRDVAISPDGSRIVYRTGLSGAPNLYLRSLEELEGTHLFSGALNAHNPVFSPDGAWIAFATNSDQTWKKVSVHGGPPVTLFPAATPPRGLSWGLDDTLIFANVGTGLLRGPAVGGEPEVLTTLNSEQGEVAHSWPELLPGGEAVLFNIVKEDGMEIAVLDLATGERKILLTNGSDPHYTPSGHIIYAVDTTLFAARFDLDRREVTGDPVPLLEGVMTDFGGPVEFSVSADGSLVYVAGDPQGSALRSLVWVDREGREEVLRAEPRTYTYPRISPDGSQLALDVRDQENDIWIWDFNRETLTRLTFDAGNDYYPAWTPDGRRVAFGSSRAGGPSNLFWKAADGTGTVERLAESEVNQYPYGFSPDGKQLLYRESVAAVGIDLGVLSLQSGGSLLPLVATVFNERNAEISPDGGWLAYESDASGQYEVYVQPFPNVDEGRWQISTGGGTRPLWARDGSELFYVRPDGQLMAVSVNLDSGIGFGTPEAVFEQTYYVGSPGRSYEISPDGTRFLMIKEGTGDDAPPAELILVQNWFEELKRLVPTD